MSTLLPRASGSPFQITLNLTTRQLASSCLWRKDRLIQIEDDDRLAVDGQRQVPDSLFAEEFELCNGKAHANAAFK